eukprot:2113205-Karenia_brevis.AAC.1
MSYESKSKSSYKTDSSDSPGDLEFWPDTDSDLPDFKLGASRESDSQSKASNSKSKQTTLMREANAGGYEATPGGAPPSKSLRYKIFPIADYRKPGSS